MIRTLLTNLLIDKTLKKDSSSEFSKFFRTAPSRRKKQIYLDAARKATREQIVIINDASI